LDDDPEIERLRSTALYRLGECEFLCMTQYEALNIISLFTGRRGVATRVSVVPASHCAAPYDLLAPGAPVGTAHRMLPREVPSCFGKWRLSAVCRKVPLRNDVTVLDSILASPYRPAAREKSHIEAGHTSAPDHMLTNGKIMLAFTGASTHVRPRPLSGSSTSSESYATKTASCACKRRSPMNGFRSC
jgi:hypothetical protein